VQPQRAAFDNESYLSQRSGANGPEGYDTVLGLMDLVRRTDLLKIVWKGTTVGGLAVKDSGRTCRLVRLFVEPRYQGMGIGWAAFKMVMEHYPDATRWELDTPSWPTRNH
jgi:GNAT superfamily N-acetyltransferase